MSKSTQPEIARVSSYEGGDVVQVFGEGFSESSRIYWWRPDGAPGEDDWLLTEHDRQTAMPECPPPQARVFTPDAVVERVLYFGDAQTVPGGTAVLWIETDGIFSRPIVADAPQIWNVSAEVLRPGGTVSVYGNDLGQADRVRTAVLRRRPDGMIVRLRSAQTPSYAFDVHRYRAQFCLPEDTPDGEYELFYHSGKGGAVGWSSPVPVSVSRTCDLIDYYAEKWQACTGSYRSIPAHDTEIVVADPAGAFADVTDALQAAIDKMAAAGQGAVILSAGIFAISRTLQMRPGVALIGAGAGATTIRACEGRPFTQDWSDICFARRRGGAKGYAADWQPHMAKYHEAALIRIADHAGIDSLRLELGGGANIGVLLASEGDDAVTRSFISHVTVEAGGLTEFETDGVFGAIGAGLLSVSPFRDLTVWNSRFCALMPISLLPAKNEHLCLIDNHIECRPRQMSESYFCGLHHSVVEGNTFAGGRRSFMCQMGFSDNWVYQNRSIDVARSQNAQEVYMSEHGEGIWHGRASAVGAQYIEIDADTDDGKLGEGLPLSSRLDEDGYYLCIADGRGFGQYRKIVAADGYRLTVDRVWDVMPDEDTLFTLVITTHHNLWVDNSSTLSNGPTQFIWNGGIENVISGHMIDLASEIRLFGLVGHREFSVVAFNTVSLCQVRASGSGLRLDHACYEGEPVQTEGFSKTNGIFGNCIRHNAFDGDSGLMYLKNQHEWMDMRHPAGVTVGGGYNRVIHNRINGYEHSVMLIDDCAGNYFAKNDFSREGERFCGEGTPIGTDAVKRER